MFSRRMKQEVATAKNKSHLNDELHTKQNKSHVIEQLHVRHNKSHVLAEIDKRAKVPDDSETRKQRTHHLNIHLALKQRFFQVSQQKEAEEERKEKRATTPKQKPVPLATRLALDEHNGKERVFLGCDEGRCASKNTQKSSESHRAYPKYL